MSLAAQQLRKRKPIRNRKVESKINSAKKENLYVHDVWTLGYVGLSLIITFVGVGHICIALCFLIDAAAIYYWKHEYTMTNMKKLYCSSLVATALLAIAAGQFEQLAGPFKMHILTTMTAPLYIIHRRNKNQVLLELAWVLGWLLLKCGITWIAAFQYFNMAGKMYSDWVTVTNRTPLINPWTNPPAILVLIIAVFASIVDFVESCFIISSNHRLI
jgi:hypothetical protein